jgi:hypothetical protein
LNDFSSLRLKNHAIIVCSKGWMKIQTADKTVEIHADDVLLCPQNLSVDHCEFSSDYECKMLSLPEQIIHGLLHDKISVWNHAVFLNETIVVSMTEQCREEFGLYYALISSKIQNHKEAPRDIIQTLIRALLLELCSIVEKNSLIIGGDAKQSQGKTLFNRFLQMLLLVLRKLGIQATSTSRNDVLIDGRKVSGTAFHHLPGRSIVHGTLLYDTNMEHMLNAITPSAEKLRQKGIQSVRQRITLLKDYVSLTLPQLKEHIRLTLCDSQVLLQPAEVLAIGQLEKQYLRDDFIHLL